MDHSPEALDFFTLSTYERWFDSSFTEVRACADVACLSFYYDRDDFDLRSDWSSGSFYGPFSIYFSTFYYIPWHFDCDFLESGFFLNFF